MRLTLQVDGMTSEIDTRDPDLLARWLLEQFALIRWSPASYVTAHAYPSWSDLDDGGRARADWLTNSAWLTNRWIVKTPEDVVEGLRVALETAREEERAAKR